MENILETTVTGGANNSHCTTLNMNFVWSEFGVLDRWFVNKYGTLFIFNNRNECRKMSPKYGQNITKIIEKLKTLKGKNIQIRTSNNTGKYSVLEWFSNLSLADTEIENKEQSLSTTESHDKIITKMKGLEESLHEKNKKIELEQKAKAALEQSLKKASDKAETFQEKNTALIQENIQLQNDYDDLNRIQQDEVDEMAAELLEMDLVDTNKDVQCRTGHATKAFALRLGINRKNRGRLNIHIKENKSKNVYRVLLLDHGDREAEMALGIKNGILHVRTVYSDLPDWDTNLFKICGVKDKIAKQSGDTYSHDALVGYYERVLSSLNLH